MAGLNHGGQFSKKLRLEKYALNVFRRKWQAKIGKVHNELSRRPLCCSFYVVFHAWPNNIYFHVVCPFPKSITIHCYFTVHFHFFFHHLLYTRDVWDHLLCPAHHFKILQIHENITKNTFVAFELFRTLLRSYISNNQHL